MSKAVAERVAEHGHFSLSYYILLSWHSPRLRSHLPSPGNPLCCPMPVVHDTLPPAISPLPPTSPAPATTSTQNLSAGSIKQVASMARSFRLLPRESGISFPTSKSCIFGITLIYKHIIFHKKNIWSADPSHALPDNGLTYHSFCYAIQSHKYFICFSQQSNNTSSSLARLYIVTACITISCAEPGLVSTT